MPLKTISVTQQTANDFTQNVGDKLSGRELGKIVSFEVKGDELIVQISKLGKSVLAYGVEKTEHSGFVARLKSEKIALAHRAFRSEIESKLSKVLKECGAEVSTSP